MLAVQTIKDIGQDFNCPGSPSRRQLLIGCRIGKPCWPSFRARGSQFSRETSWIAVVGAARHFSGRCRRLGDHFARGFVADILHAKNAAMRAATADTDQEVTRWRYLDICSRKAELSNAGHEHFCRAAPDRPVPPLAVDDQHAAERPIKQEQGFVIVCRELSMSIADHAGRRATST